MKTFQQKSIIKPFRFGKVCKGLLPFLLLALTLSTRAQYVTIPDSTFAAWLRSNGFASCMSGNQLDTTCNAVLTAQYIACNSIPIKDLTGIQYFKTLNILDCSSDEITYIPSFPASLFSINCGNNNLDSLPVLPPNLDSLACYSNLRLSNLPTLPASLTFLAFGSTSITTLPSLPANLQTLDCEGGSVITLPPADNLTYLDCSNNQITSLPSYPNLYWFDCSGNKLTTLPELGNSIVYLYAEENLLTTVTNLPASLQWAWLFNNRLSTLPTIPASWGLNLLCNYNLFSTLPALPSPFGLCNFDYNLLTTIPPLPDSLSGFSCEHNFITSLPTLPRTLWEFYCSDNMITSLPALPDSLNWFHCSYNRISSLPPLPSTLQYFNCDHNELTQLPALPDSLAYFDCSGNPNLACLPVLHHIGQLFFDSTAVVCVPNYGVVGTSNPPLASVSLCGVFNPYGCNYLRNISGQCFYDENNDCIFDSIDAGTQYAKTMLYSGGTLVEQTYGGGEGFYSFDSVPYGNYIVQVDTSNLPFIVECPGNNYYTDTISSTDSLSYNNNFAFKCRTEGFDLGVKSILNNYVFPRPSAVITVNTIAGDMSQLYGAHCAGGIGGEVQLVFSGPVHYVGPAAGALTPTTVSGDTVTWSITDFGAINDYSAFNLVFKVDTFAAPSSLICVTANVTPTSGDYNPSNNTLNYCFTVVDAIDPNEKEVYPTDSVSNGQWLTYTIRFQNTGTAPAQNIQVTDTLDSDLDASTFQLLNFSAKNTTQINGRVVNFYFPNINLADSLTGDSASRGFVQFKIKLLGNLPVGTEVQNTAYIYFDLNPAVVTNTTTNVVSSAVSNLTPTLSKGEGLFNIYPNPAKNYTTVQLSDNLIGSTLELADETGRRISTQIITSPQLQLNTSALAGGVYFVKVIADNGAAVKRLVVEK